MSRTFHEMSAREIAAGVRGKAFRAAQVAEHFLARIAKFNAGLNAFLHVDREVTLAHARRVDDAVASGRWAGALAGVPVALKDNLCLRGMPTTCASKILEGWRPPYDADAVAKLLAAGAVPLGKTNLDEFAMGSSTENSAFGPTRNPWDTRLVPGGSSGGSAAAVAAGLAPLALGSDTGGSIRQPAALCGVHGMMGTYGRVSRRGLVAFGSSLDRVGPIARNVGDVALALQLMSGGDEGDATTIHRFGSEWSPELAAGTYTALDQGLGKWHHFDQDRKLRVGVLPFPPDISSSDNEVLEHLERVTQFCKDVGVFGGNVYLTTAKHAVAVYYLLAPSEASSNLARYDGVRFGARIEAPDLTAMLAETREHGFGPEVKRRILLGTFALSSGYSEAFYEKALRVRRLIANDYAEEFKGVDLIISPTSPFPAFPIGDKVDDPLAMYLCDEFTIPASLAGLPAASVPIGRTKAGLPVGLQIVAPALREDLIFRFAQALESKFGTAELPEAYR